MIFPITDLTDDRQSEKWLLEHFHPEGLRCPKCGSTRRRFFRKTQTSRLAVYRCLECEGIYNLYSATLFEKETLASLPGGSALARGSQRRIEHEVGAGAWGEPHHGAPAAQRATAKRPEAATGGPSYRRSYGDRRDVPKRGGKKVSDIRTRRIRPDDGPTSDVGTAATTTIGHRLSGRWGGGPRR